MDAMIETTGIDVLKAISAEDGEAFVRARHKCRACRDEAACREWLLESSEAMSSPPDFCANADFFRLLQSGSGSPEDHS